MLRYTKSSSQFQISRQFKNSLVNDYKYFHTMNSQFLNKSSSAYQMIKLELFSKNDCGLCIAAKQVISKILENPQVDNSKIQYKVIDITHPENKEWWDSYCFDVPVLHLTRGDQQHPVKFFHRMSESRIIDAINSK